MKRALVSLTAAIVLVGASAALAATPDAYLGHSTATGLNLTLTPPDGDPQGLTIGFTEAAVDSGDVEPGEDGVDRGCDDDAHLACADAAGEAIFGEHAIAFWPGNEGPNDATAFTLPEEFAPLLEVELGQATAQAGDGPDATADAGAAEITLTANEQLPPELSEGLQEITGPICEGTADTPLERLGCSLDQVVEDITQVPLVKIYLGPTTSETVVDGDHVTATGTAQGAVIVVMPTEASTAENPEGYVIVEVGAAQATAQTDQFEASADFDPAILRIRILDVTTGEYDEIPVEGDTGCAAEDTPLEICVVAGSGSTTVDGASAAARAAGVQISALADPLPTLDLALASAEAAVTAAPAPAPAAVAPDEPSMPRTGGGYILPGLLLLGGAIGIRRLRG